MGTEIRLEGSRLIVKLPKEVDHPVSDHIRQETDRIMGKTYVRVIEFDFSDTEFMDSSGIGMVMGRYRALGMKMHTILATHVSRYIEKLLRLSGVHRYVEIERDTEIIENGKGEKYGKYE